MANIFSIAKQKGGKKPQKKEILPTTAELSDTQSSLEKNLKITFLGYPSSDGISEIQNAPGWHALCHHTGGLNCLWKSATWNLGSLDKTI